MAMIYALIMKEKKGIYGNTEFKRAGEAIFLFDVSLHNRFL